MPSLLHARTSSRPASVSPGPVSGDAGKQNGTPSANAFGRDHTSPIDRSPRSYQSCEIREVGRERIGAFEVHDRRDATRLEVVCRGRERHRQRLQRRVQLVRDA